MTRPTKEAYDLSNAERRDLIALIQQGKPLPEKYRFILFEDKREVELVWNGKTRDVCTTVLPFQTLEHVDEPRPETKASPQSELFDPRGRQVRGWTNKLIWGDNKLILSSLKSGPLREQIEEAGGLKLIYIDPPFDVGADFSMDIEIGGETFHKEPNILEQIAYRDTWGRGADSFIAMIYERLILMRDLLAEDGSIYVHCDWRVNSHIRLAMDEVFGRDRQLNQIVWKRIFSHSGGNKFGIVDDTILVYTRSDRFVFNKLTKPHSDSYIKSHYGSVDEHGRKFRLVTLSAKGNLLAFEFEMGLFPAVLDEARGKGIELTPKHIPPDVFDKRAVERGQVVFHDIAFIEATPRYDAKDKASLQIELTDFSVYYTQGAMEAVVVSLREGKSQVVCDGGQLYKVSKSKAGVVSRETLTKAWTDWVDYWAVDFDYGSRKEIVKRPKSLALQGNLVEPSQGELVEWEDWWTGGYIFENEWQSFRTRQDRKLELKTAPHSYARAGRYQVAVKVIDIFGNDTMTLIPVSVG